MLDCAERIMKTKKAIISKKGIKPISKSVQNLFASVFFTDIGNLEIISLSTPACSNNS